MTYIIGADEVGYGSYAGPLVVCAIHAKSDWRIDGLADSKSFKKSKVTKTSAKRESVAEAIEKLIASGDIRFALAERSNTQIDKVGVAVALKECYVECFTRLYGPDTTIIVDGILKFDNLGIDDYHIKSIIKADTTEPTVMAASIFAKTYRDKKMKILHKQYPNYGWDHNAGYHSKDHIEGLDKYGPSPLHRMSYAPMKHMKVEDPRQLKLF